MQLTMLTQSPRSHSGLSRRDFLRVCTLAAAAVGLPSTAAKTFAEAVAKGKRPSVIWLSFQECTGCTESLLRTSHPALDELIVDLISLDYHEALLAPSGHLAEEARAGRSGRRARPGGRRSRTFPISSDGAAIPAREARTGMARRFTSALPHYQPFPSGLITA